MIRFIHAADIHLDSLMKGIRSEIAGIDSATFRESTQKALRNLVDWAIAEKVDFVTLGGDNYDGDWKSFATGLIFVQEMKRLDEAGIPVVSIRGNHDAQSKMTRDLLYPRNYKLLDHDKPESFEVLDGVFVTGQSFGKEAETGNLVANYPANDSTSAVHIGLLHTALAGGSRDGHDNYAPCVLDDLYRKRYHFWGLGHIHKAGWMHASGETPVLYPGNLQGRHPRETGEKGAWLISLSESGGMVDRQFQALDTTRWEIVTVDISDAVTLDDCWNSVESALVPVAESAGARPVAARVCFTGTSHAHVSLRRESEKEIGRLEANCQNAANLACRNRIWVEKVELRSSAPQEFVNSSDAMLVLSDFIGSTASSDLWIADFLGGSEIAKLRNQVDRFESLAERKELSNLFSAETLRELMAEIPEILEAKLQENASQREGA